MVDTGGRGGLRPITNTTPPFEFIWVGRGELFPATTKPPVPMNM